MNRSDDDLIAAYLEGDLEAFDALYDRYAARLYGFALALGGGPQCAEDVVQKCWLNALEALGRYRARDRFRPWLFQIAHRVWLDHVRSASERKRVAFEGAEDADFEGVPIAFGDAQSDETPYTAAIRNETMETVYEAIGDLPDGMRQTVLLRIDGGMSHREIADVMGCPLGTALWRMNEAQRRLRAALGSTV